MSIITKLSFRLTNHQIWHSSIFPLTLVTNLILCLVLANLEISAQNQPDANSQKITVFTEQDYQGDQQTVDAFNCTNLFPRIFQRVKSVNTGGNCVRLYSEMGCRGRFIELYPRSPKHTWLLNWDFSDLTASTGPCSDPCDVKVTGEVATGETNEIVLFSESWWEGDKAVVAVRGCTIIPYEFTTRLVSVETKGTCFQLYNNYNCQTEGDNVYSIELRKGTPNHFDVKSESGWGLSEARAVSHCRYKCQSTGRIENDLSYYSPSVDYQSTTEDVYSWNAGYYSPTSYDYSSTMDYASQQTDYSSTESSPTVYKANATIDHLNNTLKVVVNFAEPLTG